MRYNTLFVYSWPIYNYVPHYEVLYRSCTHLRIKGGLMRLYFTNTTLCNLIIDLININRFKFTKKKIKKIFLSDFENYKSTERVQMQMYRNLNCTETYGIYKITVLSNLYTDPEQEGIFEPR